MAAAAGRRKRTSIGGYKLLYKIGAGGMSEVWRAEKPGPGGAIKPSVIKIILPHLADSEKRIQRFIDEGRLHAQLSHANVVVVHDFGVEDDEYFLVLEHVRGLDLGSLREALGEHALARPSAPPSPDAPAWERELHEWHAYFQRGVLPPVFVAWLGMKAAGALAYVHTVEIRDGDRTILGLVHRDVSDCNIMLDVHGRLVLMDLGIAKAMSDGSKASATDTAWGKLAYSPAEQFSGQEIDPSADLYALGITLYILLSAAHPFDDPHASPNEHPWNRAGRMARDAREPIRALLPDVPPALSDILEGLIQANVENRTPRKAAELVERFHEVIKSLGSDLLRLEKQAAALVSRVYVDRDKDRTDESPISHSPPERPVAEASHERPVSKVTAPDKPAVLARERAPDTIVDHTPPTMELAPSSRSKLWAGIGVAALVLAALVAGVVGFVVVPGGGSSGTTSDASSPAAGDEQPTRVVERTDPSASPRDHVADVHALAPPMEASGSSETTIRGEAPSSPPQMPEQPTPASPETAGDAPTQADEPSASEHDAEADPARRLGTLRVIVIPRGDVSIEGRPRGRAPTTTRLPAGQYRVTVGRDGRTEQSRTVTVRPGHSQTERFTLPLH